MAVGGTGVELRAGFRVDPVEAPDRIPVAVTYVADGHVGRVFADVPKRHLSAHQATGQTLRIPVVELQGDDRMRRLDRETRDGGVL